MEKIEKLLKEFKKLKLPNDQYFIFGSGPLGVRKIRELNNLIDSFEGMDNGQVFLLMSIF